MLAWIVNNLGTLIVFAVLYVLVFAIVRGMANDKKKGKSSCGNNCAHCAMSCSCHSHAAAKNKT